MKTTVKGLLAILFAVFMFSTVTTKAQCAKIVNTTNCELKVTATLYTRMQSRICNVVCSTTSGNVMANTSFGINCPCDFCNMSVTVYGIGGISITPVTVDFTSGPQSFPPNFCGATGIKYDPTIPGFVAY